MCLFRIAIQTKLPGKQKILIRCVGTTFNIEKHYLAISSISCVAPSSVGPYSQSVSINNAIFLSGQLGLIPSRMALPYVTYSKELKNNFNASLFIETIFALNNILNTYKQTKESVYRSNIVCEDYLTYLIYLKSSENLELVLQALKEAVSFFF